jgi:threonine dehydrogenase-like Zn-dependent dehydrogenase
MGIVEEAGANHPLKKGDRVLIPFQISCGTCYFCKRMETALCDTTNPEGAEKMQKAYGQAAAGLFGYSHLYGGYPGGQAQYVRVPCADFGAFKVPESLSDEQVLFLTDIFPTGFMAAENCAIESGQTVAVWGCGPVGQFAIRSAFLLGAGRVIALDNIPERLEMARKAGAETLDDEDTEVQEKLRAMTSGRGPDHCIDAVGMEAHGATLDALYDRLKTAVMLETDRSHALRAAIFACAKGGTVSIPGVYGGFLDKFPLGGAFAKGLTLKMGQTNVHRYLPRLLDFIQKGKIDPSFVITHRLALDDAADGYNTFHDRKGECIKVVLKPHGLAA